MNFKNIVFTGLFILISSTVFSQAAIIALLFGDKVASENFNLSMELGAPYNTYKDIANGKSTFGFNFGIAGNIKLSENWYLSPTAYFLSKRNLKVSPISLDTDDPNLNLLYTDVNADIVVNYTDLHFMLAFQPNNSNFRFGVSPQVSFFSKSRATYYNDQGEFKENFNRYVNKRDYGIIGSIGYIIKYANKGKGIHVNLRYYQGFKDVFNESFASGTSKSNYWSLHFSLPFISDELAAKNKKPEKKKNKKKKS